MALLEILSWFASISGITAAFMVSLDNGRRVTGWGFALFVLSSLAVLLQYGVSAVALFRLAGRRSRGLGAVDRALSPLCLLSIGVLAHAAKWAEIAVLLAILLLGFGVLAARGALASQKGAR